MSEALIRRLEQALGPDRELDHLLHEHCLPDDDRHLISVHIGCAGTRNAYTSSFDAALALLERVSPGCEFEFTNFMGVARVGLIPADTDVGPYYASREDGDLVLAFLAAVVSLPAPLSTGRTGDV